MNDNRKLTDWLGLADKLLERVADMDVPEDSPLALLCHAAKNLIEERAEMPTGTVLVLIESPGVEEGQDEKFHVTLLIDGASYVSQEGHDFDEAERRAINVRTLLDAVVENPAPGDPEEVAADMGLEILDSNVEGDE